VIESPVRVRPLRLGDEAAFVAAHRGMAAEQFTFGLGYADGMSWSEYLDELESHRSGADLPEGLVPATFLVAEVAGQIVGRTSIRHELNEFLARAACSNRSSTPTPDPPSGDTGSTDRRR
jgi:predicted acetyltransferase